MEVAITNIILYAYIHRQYTIYDIIQCAPEDDRTYYHYQAKHSCLCYNLYIIRMYVYVYVYVFTSS